jgi:hypothetical protein
MQLSAILAMGLAALPSVVDAAGYNLATGGLGVSCQHNVSFSYYLPRYLSYLGARTHFIPVSPRRA